jgi:4-hydroxyphenylpyruvate dioxygenase-like putative hemolysin
MAASPDINDLNARLDAIDEQLFDLLGARLELVREIAAQNGGPAAAHARADTNGSPTQPVEGSEHGDRAAQDAREGHERGAADGLGRRALAIDHAAIAVRDLQSAIAVLCERFGFHVAEERRIDGTSSGMNSAVLRAGAVKLVLVQGTSPESNVSRYVEHYGPGVQHLAIEVDDAHALVGELRDRGCDLLTGVIRSPGLDQLFTRRDPHSGMQLEFVSRAENDGFSEHNVRELFEAMEREDEF